MFPIANLIDGEAELRSKIVLRKLQLLPNAANVDLRRNVELARLRVSARDLKGLVVASSFPFNGR